MSAVSRLRSFVRLSLSVVRALVELAIATVGEVVVMIVAWVHYPAYPRFRRWRYRQLAGNAEAAIEALEEHPRLYGGLVDLRHPGTVDQKLEALEAERDYFRRRADILEE